MDNAIKEILRRNKRRLLAMLLHEREHPFVGPSSLGDQRNQTAALTMNEQRVWYFHKFTEKRAFDFFLFTQFDGPLDLDAFKQSLETLCKLHPQLRTGFPLVDGRPTRKLSDHVEVTLPCYDLRHLDPAAQDRELARLTSEVQEAEFDLSRPPLFSTALAHTGSERFVWIWIINHLIGDAISVQLLGNDLRRIYGATVEGGTLTIPTSEIESADIAQWQRNRNNYACTTKDLHYWTDKFERLLQSSWVEQYPAPLTGRDMRTTGKNYLLDPTSASELEQISTQLGITLFATIIGCIATLLHCASDEDEVWLGSNTSGRNQQRWRNIIGFLANDIPLRISFTGDPTFTEIAIQSHVEIMESFDHSMVPFPVLCQLIYQPDDPALSGRLFRAMTAPHVVLINKHAQDMSFSPGLRATPTSIDLYECVGDQEVWLAFVRDECGITILSSALRQAIGTQFVDELVGAFKVLISDVLDNPSQTLSSWKQNNQHELEPLRDAWRHRAVDASQGDVDIRLASLLYASMKTPPAGENIAEEWSQLLSNSSRGKQP